MKLAGKDLGYYLNIIKKPLAVYVLVCALVFAASYVFTPLLLMLGLVLVIAGAGFIPDHVGGETVNHHGGGVGNAAVAGAVFALVICCVAAVLSIGFAGIELLFSSSQPQGDDYGSFIALTYLIGLPFYGIMYIGYSTFCAGLFGAIAQHSMNKKKTQ